MLLENHLITDGTYMFKLHFHHVPILQPRRRFHECGHATRSPCHDDRPLSDGHSTAEMADDGWNVEDQVVGLGHLPLFPVHEAPHLELLGVGDDVSAGYDGADGRKLVKRLGCRRLVVGTFGHLPPSSRHVVAHGVAQDVLSNVFVLPDVLTILAYDYT